jgi:hypothetical protein
VRRVTEDLMVDENHCGQKHDNCDVLKFHRHTVHEVLPRDLRRRV